MEWIDAIENHIYIYVYIHIKWTNSKLPSLRTVLKESFHITMINRAGTGSSITSSKVDADAGIWGVP